MDELHNVVVEALTLPDRTDGGGEVAVGENQV
jgi:hypothetical protein